MNMVTFEERTNKQKREICCFKKINKNVCMQNTQGLEAVSEYVKILRKYNGTEQVQTD